MHLGLYDIDLWHNNQKTFPNLELAKVANYHRQKGDMVTMLTPKIDEGRFDKIIYFKEKKDSCVNQNLILTGSNKELYGQGFYNKFYPLDDIYKNVPPAYLIYEPFFDKLVKEFKNLKKNSFIRIENYDFTDFKKNCKTLYIADINYFDTSSPFDFIDEYKNYYFYFIHGIHIHDQNLLPLCYKYEALFKTAVQVRCNYTEQIFKQYAPYNFDFLIHKQRENETQSNYILRIAVQILYYKTLKRTIAPRANSKAILGNKILLWGAKNLPQSFETFYQNDKEVQKLLVTAPSDLRCVLKTNPLKIKSSEIDFFGTL